MLMEGVQTAQAVVVEMRWNDRFDRAVQLFRDPGDELFGSTVLRRRVEDDDLPAIPHDKTIAGYFSEVLGLVVGGVDEGVLRYLCDDQRTRVMALGGNERSGSFGVEWGRTTR